MTTILYRNKALGRQFRGFKWARNNSLQLLKAAQTHGVFDFQPSGIGQHTILYQFQCLATTTDAYYRMLRGADNKAFGVLVAEGVGVLKKDTPEAGIHKILSRQTLELEMLLRDFDDEAFEANARSIQSLTNHEYLHQGQLIVMFREAGVPLPERFREAFDL